MPRQNPPRGVVAIRLDPLVRALAQERADRADISLSEQIRRDVALRNPDSIAAATARAGELLRAGHYTVHSIDHENWYCETCRERHMVAVAIYDDKTRPLHMHRKMCVCSRTLDVTQAGPLDPHQT